MLCCAGQLGVLNAADFVCAPTTPIAGLAGVVSIAAGSQHACVVTVIGDSSAVSCWGYGIYGQLGRGSTANRYAGSLALAVTT